MHRYPLHAGLAGSTTAGKAGGADTTVDIDAYPGATLGDKLTAALAQNK